MADTAGSLAQVHNGRHVAAKLPEILHCPHRNSSPPPLTVLPVACDSPNRKAVPSEKPLAPGNLLVAVPFETVTVVRRFVRRSVVDPGHDLMLDLT